MSNQQKEIKLYQHYPPQPQPSFPKSDIKFKQPTSILSTNQPSVIHKIYAKEPGHPLTSREYLTYNPNILPYQPFQSVSFQNPLTFIPHKLNQNQKKITQQLIKLDQEQVADTYLIKPVETNIYQDIPLKYINETHQIDYDDLLKKTNLPLYNQLEKTYQTQDKNIKHQDTPFQIQKEKEQEEVQSINIPNNYGLKVRKIRQSRYTQDERLMSQKQGEFTPVRKSYLNQDGGSAKSWQTQGNQLCKQTIDVISERINQMNQQKEESKKQEETSQQISKQHMNIGNQFKEMHLDGIGYYFGQVDENKLNGFGKLFNEENQIIYEGWFQDNEFEGPGILYITEEKQSDKNVDIYEFVRSKLDDKNRIELNEMKKVDQYQKKYQGMFEKSRREGFGLVDYRDGSQFAGMFKGDQYQGEGMIKSSANEEIFIRIISSSK